jgi:hypothetical protein
MSFSEKGLTCIYFCVLNVKIGKKKFVWHSVCRKHSFACLNHSACRNYTPRVEMTLVRVVITLVSFKLTRIRVKITLVCVETASKITLCVCKLCSACKNQSCACWNHTCACCNQICDHTCECHNHNRVCQNYKACGNNTLRVEITLDRVVIILVSDLLLRIHVKATPLWVKTAFCM